MSSSKHVHTSPSYALVPGEKYGRNIVGEGSLSLITETMEVCIHCVDKATGFDPRKAEFESMVRWVVGVCAILDVGPFEGGFERTNRNTLREAVRRLDR